VSPQAAFCPARTLPGIGDRIVRIEPLLGGVQQMHASGVGVAMVLSVARQLSSQQVAVGRVGIDTGQHGHGTVEDLIVQAHPNA